MKKKEITLPLIPLRELVSLPAAIIPILVGREKSINAKKGSRDKYNGFIFLSTQTNQVTEDPTGYEISRIGVIARIEKSAEQNNGSFRVIIHGLERGKIQEFIQQEQYFLVKVQPLKDIIEKGRNYFELSRNLITIFEEYITIKRVKLHGIIAKLESNQVSEITDIIISMINIPLKLKQSLLEELNVYTRGVKVYNILKKELFKLKANREEPRKDKEDVQASEIDARARKVICRAFFAYMVYINKHISL